MRSNPSLNKKKGVAQTIKDIHVANKNQLIFGRFTDTPKIGINPQSSYSSTPRGIYAYPLDHIIKNLKRRTYKCSIPSRKALSSNF